MRVSWGLLIGGVFKLSNARVQLRASPNRRRAKRGIRRSPVSCNDTLGDTRLLRTDCHLQYVYIVPTHRVGWKGGLRIRKATEECEQLVA